MSKLITWQPLSEDSNIFHRFHFNLWSSDIYLHVTFFESKLQTGYITDLALKWRGMEPQSGSLHNIIVSLQLGKPTSFHPLISAIYQSPQAPTVTEDLH